MTTICLANTVLLLLHNELYSYFIGQKLFNIFEMDVECTWILRQGGNCRQFSLLVQKSFSGLFVNPVGWEEYGIEIVERGIII